MKERGIILTADEVRGLRDGSLRELRRPAKVPRRALEVYGENGRWLAYCDAPSIVGGEVEMNDWTETIRCPFGQPGDRLWVRETWHPCARMGLDVLVEYRATKDEMEREWDGRGDIDALIVGWWRSPATMPRWASRWTLENTAVRVEWNATAERWGWVIGVKQVEP